MKKVTVIGMDMGDKNHKAIGLSEDGEIIDRCEVPCRPEDVRAYLERFPYTSDPPQFSVQAHPRPHAREV